MPASTSPLSEQTQSLRSSFEQDGHPSFGSPVLSLSLPRKLGQITRRSTYGQQLAFPKRRSRLHDATPPLQHDPSLFLPSPSPSHCITTQPTTNMLTGHRRDKEEMATRAVAHREAGGWMEIEERSSWSLKSCLLPLSLERRSSLPQHASLKGGHRAGPARVERQ